MHYSYKGYLSGVPFLNLLKTSPNRRHWQKDFWLQKNCNWKIIPVHRPYLNTKFFSLQVLNQPWFCSFSENRKNGGSYFRSSVSLAFLLPSAVASITTSSFSFIWYWSHQIKRPHYPSMPSFTWYRQSFIFLTICLPIRNCTTQTIANIKTKIPK